MNIQASSSNKVPQVVILGAGFGGLRAARALAKAPVQVTLVDRNNYHLFQPLLYQVATAGLSPDEIAYPVRGIFRKQRNFTFRMDEVTSIDLENKRLNMLGGELAYDYLILAPGGQTNYFGIKGLAERSYGLKSIDDATGIRNHLLRQFELASQETDPEKRRARLSIVVVGGGPSGVECAGAISELVRMVLTRDHPTLNLEDVHIQLLEATDRLLMNLPEDLGKETAEVLRRKHVDVRFGAALTSYDGNTITLKSGETIATRTLIWAAGVRASRLLDGLGVAQDRMGRVLVTPTLQIPEHPEVYVVGDAAHFEENGAALGMVAPVAMQQAEHAAKNIIRRVEGNEQVAFQYKDPGSLATIGRNQAVAKLGNLKFKGFPAWVVWLAVHIMQLVGFRNRLVVLVTWAWDYLFYDRAVRLISAECQKC